MWFLKKKNSTTRRTKDKKRERIKQRNLHGNFKIDYRW